MKSNIIKTKDNHNFEKYLENSIVFPTNGIVFRNKIEWFSKEGKIIASCSTNGLFSGSICNDIGVNKCG